MMIDRDLYIDMFFNVEGFAADGIDIGEKRWHSHLNCPFDEFWLDPQNAAPEGLGDIGRWWHHDPEEARKLVEAAGVSIPVAAPMHKIDGGNYGSVYHQWAEVLANMYNEGGTFNITLNPVDYATEFTPRMSATGDPTGGHDFEGLAFGAIGGTGGGYADPDAIWGQHFTPGATFYKFEENFVESRFLELNQAQSREMDSDERVEIVKETQRFLAEWFPIILFPGLAKGVQLYQAWHGNAGVYIDRDATGKGWTSSFRHRWFDESKM